MENKKQVTQKVAEDALNKIHPRQEPAKRSESAQADTLCENFSGNESVFYKVKEPCRVGEFRQVGEVFLWSRFVSCPSYLEELKE